MARYRTPPCQRPQKGTAPGERRPERALCHLEYPSDDESANPGNLREARSRDGPIAELAKVHTGAPAGDEVGQRDGPSEKADRCGAKHSC